MRSPGPDAAAMPPAPDGDAALAGEDEPSSNKVFVGQVPKEMDADALRPFFEPMGTVLDVFIVRDKLRVSKGCAFVTFKTKTEAARCIEEMQGTLLPGGVAGLKISYARAHDPEAKLFVGQLPLAVDEAALRSVFEPFGEIIEATVLTKDHAVTTKGSAFIRYRHADSAKSAIAALHGKNVLGESPIKVTVAHSGSGSRAASSPHMAPLPSSRFQPVIVPYPWFPAPPPVPLDAPNVHFPKLFVAGLARTTTEPLLYQIFAPFGLVREVVVLRFPTGLSKMCGFVRFSSPDEAQRAILSLSDRVRLPGSNRPLLVTLAGQGARPETKLYVGRLPPNSTDETLQALFAPYGHVSEVFLMRDQTGAFKGSGFVKFPSRTDAEAAIGALNGQIITGSQTPLVVSIALSPKDRIGGNKN